MCLLTLNFLINMAAKDPGTTSSDEVIFVKEVFHEKMDDKILEEMKVRYLARKKLDFSQISYSSDTTDSGINISLWFYFFYNISFN